VEENISAPSTNTRSGFMTFIFIFYLLSAIFEGMNLFMVGLIALASVFIGPLPALLGFVFTAAAVISFVFLIIYLTKAYSMSVALKRWTDIYHMISIGTSIIIYAVTLALQNVWPEVETSTEGFAVLTVLLSIGLLVELLFWLGIRTHLARLEREGKATFNPGLFNKKPKPSNHS
jgi:hypothetical protein